MKLRDLFKCNSINDGSRSLYESILNPEVEKAMRKWEQCVPLKGVLIGGLALAYYVKPRMTIDADFLFLSAGDIPSEVDGFKRTRPSAFMHKETHVEFEVLAPEKINMPIELAKKIIETAKKQDNVFVASREGLIASKLERFKFQDRADINALLQLGPVDLSEFPLDDLRKRNFQIALDTFEPLDGEIDDSK
jgi:hypothetical protein